MKQIGMEIDLTETTKKPELKVKVKIVTPSRVYVQINGELDLAVAINLIAMLREYGDNPPPELELRERTD